MNLPRVLAALPILLAAFAASAEEKIFQSGPAQVGLVELFTSEGCSSCPPAEQWMNALREDAGLWTRFVPVAFHVNYWDHLGWKDALASKAFTEREHAYADAWRAASVYTPCFVRNGEEWRPQGASPGAGGTKNAGRLTLHWSAADNTCRVEYAPAAGVSPAVDGRRKFEVFVTLLGGGIVNDVRRGENSGRTLRHEFVALRLEKRTLVAGAEGTLSATVTLPPRTDLVVPRRAIAAWITQGGLAPVQAAGGWLE